MEHESAPSAQALNGRAVLIRSGGLGDFLLSVPLLRALEERFERVLLVTRGEYGRLARHPRDRFLDIDSAEAASLWSGRPGPAWRGWLNGAAVFGFTPDPDGELANTLRRAGVAAWNPLVSRPGAPPHVTLRAFEAAGLAAPPGLLRLSVWAERRGPAPDAFWIHPGSGSLGKNAPLPFFTERAREWIAATGQPVIVSIGPAESGRESEIRRAFEESGLDRLEFAVGKTAVELAEILAERAARFLGNDTGVTHLAAALGIPTEAVFVNTNPEIWRPLGQTVTITRMSPC